MKFLWFFIFAGLISSAHAETFKRDQASILASAGCFVVDYNYHEVQALIEGYELDPREYHVSANKDFEKFAQMYSMLDPSVAPETYQFAMKEKIFPRIDARDGSIHLQHIVFLTNKDGELDFIMKHHSERWTYEAERVFQYEGGSLWVPTEVEDTRGRWTREMNSLDDSPRYACTGAWDYSAEYPRWKCSTYSPIPGREYRDMDRGDYQGLNRIHELTIYPNAWLDTQTNEKVYEKEDGSRVPFVLEKGRNWYTRLPDADCDVTNSFIEERQGFWVITQNVWNEFLAEGQAVYEGPGNGPRWMPINGGPFIVHPGRKMVQYRQGLEERFVASPEKQNDQAFRDELAAAVRKIIQDRNKAPN